MHSVCTELWLTRLERRGQVVPSAPPPGVSANAAAEAKSRALTKYIGGPEYRRNLEGQRLSTLSNMQSRRATLARSASLQGAASASGGSLQAPLVAAGETRYV